MKKSRLSSSRYVFLIIVICLSTIFSTLARADNFDIFSDSDRQNLALCIVVFIPEKLGFEARCPEGRISVIYLDRTDGDLLIATQITRANRPIIISGRAVSANEGDKNSNLKRFFEVLDSCDVTSKCDIRGGYTVLDYIRRVHTQSRQIVFERESTISGWDGSFFARRLFFLSGNDYFSIYGIRDVGGGIYFIDFALPYSALSGF